MTAQSAMKGLIFGKYEVLRRLEIGGMGEIFLARQTGLGGFERMVILKSLLPDLAQDPKAVEDFLNEARVAATLNHPNIVAIYEVGCYEGTYFIAMEYIPGINLGNVLNRSALTGVRVPFPVIARVIHDAAIALDHAHTATTSDGHALHIVHRDVSPQNIMVRADGLIKVVDFGIAKAAIRATRTEAGVFKGKFRYMSPEQLRESKLDARSDQYALGIVLWELCTGEKLFKTDAQILERLGNGRIPRPSSITPECPFDDIVMRMLSVRPEDRFSSCVEVAGALRGYLDDHAETSSSADVAAFMQSLCWEMLAERSRAIGSGANNFLIRLEGRAGGTSARARRIATQLIRRYRWYVVSAALATGAVSSALAAWLSRGYSHDPSPPIVLVEHRPTFQPSGDKAPEPPDPDPDPGTASDARMRALSGAFAQQKSEIEGCFASWLSDASGSPSVSIRFRVDTEGKVTSAEITPAALAGTPLGDCLLRTARGTRFPRQTAPISFRIPVHLARAKQD